MDVPLHPGFLWILQINFLHFAIFLFVLSVTIIMVLNTLSIKTANEIELGLRSNIGESLNEIRFNFSSFKAMQGLKSNLLLSAFIVIIIIGLWSIWY